MGLKPWQFIHIIILWLQICASPENKRMTPNVIFIIYGVFASLSIAGVSVVIRNSSKIDKALKDLEEEPFLEQMRWL